MRLKVVNWRKAFWVSGLRPPGSESSRAKLLSFLAQHQAPQRTESKYHNAIAFFEHIVKKQKLLEKTTAE
jgi:hypothetical protein